MADILIVDDDGTVCGLLMEVVRGLGHNAQCADTLEKGMSMAESGAYDVVFLDVQLPDGNGLDALPKIRSTVSNPETIIITGRADADGAELAIKSGAWDYLEKSFSIKALRLQLARALQYREQKQTVARVGSDCSTVMALRREGIVENSPRMKACLDLLAKAANSDATVLITGETGTGKELFASAIHANSPRRSGRFVVVDCATLPETLVESTLFGHVRGAFTGADRSKEGLVKQADGGTLFLDEVGELPLGIQKSFLRVLQERRFRPVGSKQEIASDFRLVAATNRNLDRMVAEGKFRKDFLFRIRSFVLELPPLRERREDIREIVLYHVARFCNHYELGIKGFSPEFIEILERYDWPGNVRELVSTVERALIVARDEPILFPVHLPQHIRIHEAQSQLTQVKHTTTPRHPNVLLSADRVPTLQEFLEDMRRQYLQDLMELTGGDIKKTCHLSGMSRTALYLHLKKYRIR